MSRTAWILGAVLVAQLMLAAVLDLGGADPGAAPPGEPLLDFKPGAVDRVEIAGPGRESVTLRRVADGWQLSDHHGAPADGTRVETLLRRLEALRTRLPVATSADAAGRFRVGAEDHERRISLSGDGETLATLYLGDTAGARRAYARRGGAETVQEVALAAYEAPVGAEDWIDRGLLRLAVEDIVRVDFPGFSLEREGETWRMADATDEEHTDPSRARDAVTQLAELPYLAVAGTELRPEWGLEAPALRLTVDLSSGESREYRLARPENAHRYLLAVSDQPWIFEVASYTVEELRALTRARMLGETPPAGEQVEE